MSAADGIPPPPPELDPRPHGRGGPSDHRPVRRGLVWGSRVISAALAVALLVGFGYEWHTYRTFNQSLTRLQIVTGAQAPGHKDIDGKDQNILIVGNDDRSTATKAELEALGTTRDGGSLNTDTMMIIHIPADGRSATLISLPRDDYVAIPGHGNNKLNAAYHLAYNAAAGDLNAKRAAGADLLIKTIFGLTGLTIDHYVQVDLFGFYRISRAVAGIKVNMCAAIYDRDSGVNLHKGVNTISGKQALAFVRQRYGFPNGLGDLDRVERQRYFLTAAFRQLTSAGIFARLPSLLTAVKSSIYVDARLNLITLAGQLENLSANNIAGQTIPFVDFEDRVISGISVSVNIVDPAAVKQFVNRLLGTSDKALSTAKAAAPSSVTVEVINAANVADVARSNAATLQRDGFTVASYAKPSNGPSSATVIEYSKGMESAAKTLAGYVPGASYQLTSGLTHVTLVLGTDGLAARYVPPARASAGAGAGAATHPAPTSRPPAGAIDAGCIH